MRPRTVDFAAAQVNPLAAPLVFVVVWGAQGCRIYSAVGLTDNELWISTGSLADGSSKGDGSTVAGAQLLPLIESSARLLQAGQTQDQLGILALGGTDVQGGYSISDLYIHLRNDDDHFGPILARDIFVSGKLSVVVGFRGMRRDKFVPRFQGIVSDHTLTRSEFQLHAVAA